MACHGPNGAGNPAAKFPALAGQHATYTIKALKDFRAGTRSNDPANMMRDVAGKMTDAQIEAVAEYIAGLH
jgi:cytochrome c553